MTEGSSKHLEQAILAFFVLLPLWISGNLSFLLILTVFSDFDSILSSGLTVMFLGVMVGALVILVTLHFRQYHSFKKNNHHLTKRYPPFLQEAFKTLWKEKYYRKMLVSSSFFDFLLGMFFILTIAVRNVMNVFFLDELVFFENFSIRINSVSIIQFILSFSLILLALLIALSVADGIRARIIKYWSKDNMIRMFGETILILSFLGTLVIASSMISSIQLFTLTMLQYLPLFIFMLALGGIFVTITAVVGILFGWIPFFLLLSDGMITNALFSGLIYIYLLLSVFIYYGSVSHLSKVGKSSFFSMTDANSVRDIEKDLKNREIDFLLRLATEQGWALWRNQPWLKIVKKDVQRRALEKHPLNHDEFAFFDRSVMYMPKISFKGVINLEKLSKTLNLDVNQLKASIIRHWGSDALFLSPTLVIHKHQLMLAESFSFDELKALNVDDINMEAMQTTIESLKYYGFTDKAQELRRAATVELKSDATRTLHAREGEIEMEKPIEDDFDAVSVRSRTGDTRKSVYPVEKTVRIQIVFPESKASRDQVIETGELLLGDGDVHGAFEWFCQNEYWDWALEVGEALLREEIRLFLAMGDQPRLIHVLKKIYDVFLKSNSIDHVILQDIALVVLFLKLDDELRQELVDKERIAFCLVDIYHLSPHLFPAENILEKTWHLFSEAENHSKAAEILQILANRSTGLEKQKYYDLQEDELQKENGEYTCIIDLKRHKMDFEERKICPRCKRSICVKCVLTAKESSESRADISCIHCDETLVGNKEDKKANHRVYCIPLDVENLIKYVTSFFSQKT